MVNWKKVLIATGVVATGVYAYRFYSYQCPDSEKGGGSFEEVYAQLLASRGMTEVSLPTASKKATHRCFNR